MANKPNVTNRLMTVYSNLDYLLATLYNGESMTESELKSILSSCVKILDPLVANDIRRKLNEEVR